MSQNKPFQVSMNPGRLEGWKLGVLIWFWFTIELHGNRAGHVHVNLFSRVSAEVLGALPESGFSTTHNFHSSRLLSVFSAISFLQASIAMWPLPRGRWIVNGTSKAIEGRKVRIPRCEGRCICMHWNGAQWWIAPFLTIFPAESRLR